MWWKAEDIFRQSNQYKTVAMIAILLEEDLTSGLCLTPTRNPNWPVNTLCISFIVGMHRLNFGKHFQLMVFGGKGDVSQTNV